LRALVTGASGFIARHLMTELGRQGWKVIGATRFPQEGNIGPHVVLGPAPWTTARLAEVLAEARPDVVFHMAGLLQASAIDLFEVNTLTAVRWFEALDLVGARPLTVLAGSAAEYGPVDSSCLPVRETQPCEPVTAYGISKLAQTLVGSARARAGQRVLMTRIFNPVGIGMPRTLALASFAHQISALPARGGTLQVGNLDMARDFIDVREAARLVVALASRPDSFGKVYNICSGRAYVLRSLLGQMIRASGRQVTVTVDAARLRPGDAPEFFGSTERLRAAGLQPRAPDFGRLLPELLDAAAAE